ncbi:hypothetical protein ACFO9Q_20085 [Paenibacillus sp. GCM10023252]|uniref:hypothetical protein n=1 Tax=Paenibacillus sp. GCM10023252 TaxID=3252649 RepID=UPI00361627FC
MEKKNGKKKWSTMLLTAVMCVTLVFGATACGDNGNDNTDVNVESTDPAGNGNSNVDVDVEDENAPAATDDAMTEDTTKTE